MLTLSVLCRLPPTVHCRHPGVPFVSYSTDEPGPKLRLAAYERTVWQPLRGLAQEAAMSFTTESVHAALGEADDSVYVAYTDDRSGGVGHLKALMVRPVADAATMCIEPPSGSGGGGSGEL